MSPLNFTAEGRIDGFNRNLLGIVLRRCTFGRGQSESRAPGYSKYTDSFQQFHVTDVFLGCISPFATRRRALALALMF